MSSSAVVDGAAGRRRRTVLVALLIVLLGLPVMLLVRRPTPTSATRPPDGESRFRFLQFNMCGGVCNGGSRGSVVAALRRSIEDFQPLAVSLNEACRSQFTALLEALRRNGYPMEGRWLETMDTSRHCSDHREGIALLSQLAITGARVWRLPRPAADVRTLLCVGIRVGREIKVCSTHITPHDENKGPQIQAVARATAFGPGVPVVLMGDFNVTPGEDYLDDVYSGPHGGGARGRFEEADATAGDGSPCRCGEATFDRPFTDPKIDYVFVTAAHWGAVHADATYSGYSDHDPVRGSAVLEE